MGGAGIGGRWEGRGRNLLHGLREIDAPECDLTLNF